MASKEIAELSIGLSLNTGNVSKDITNINKAIKNTERDFKSAGKGIDNFEKTFVGLDSKIKKTTKQIDLYNLKLDKQKEAYDKLKGTLDKQVSKLDDLESTLGKGSDKWQKQAELVAKNSSKLDKLSTDINQTESELNKLGNELYDSVNAFQKLSNETQTIEQKLSKVSRSANLAESEFDRLGSELKTSGTYFEKIGNELNKLSSKIDSNQQKVRIYESEINKLSSALDKNKLDHEQLAQKINKTESELDQAKQAYGENSNEVLELNTKLLVLKDSYRNLGNEIDKGETDLNGYQVELNQTQREINELAVEMRKLPFDKIGNDLKNAGSNIKGVGQTLTYGLTVPTIGAGTAIGVMSYNFEQGLAKVGSLVGKSGKEMKAYEGVLIDLSNNTGISLGDLTEAMYQGISAGADLTNIFGLLETASKLSIGGFTSTETAIDGLTTAMNAYGISYDEVDKVADKFILTQNKGKTTVDELASSMGKVAPIANTAGVSLDELLSATAALTMQGIETSEAMTYIKSALSNVIKPSSEAQKMAKSLGIEFNATSIQSKGLSGFLQDVSEKTGGNVETMAKLFGSTEALNAMLVLTGEGAGTFTETLNGMENSTGLATEAFEGMKESAGAKMLDAINSLKNSLTSMGDAIAPVIEWLAEKIEDLSSWFSSLDEDAQKNIVTMAGLAAAIGPVLSVVGTLLSVGGNMTLMMGSAGGATSLLSGALGILSGPIGIGAAILAFGALASSVGDNSETLLGLQEKFGGFGTVIGGTCEFISGIWTATFEQLFNVAQLGMDLIAAVIDGPGGATVKDAWQRYNDKTVALQEEAADKLTLTTTRGLSQMRNATDEQLNGCITTIDSLLGYIPDIANGHYLNAANNMGQQLATMDSTQISTLQSMNDTTRMMFQGIKEGMDVKDATNQVMTNLELMKSNGKLNVDTLEKDVQKAMDTLKNNVDTKTKEAAKVVDTNTKDAGNKAKVNSDKTATDVGASYQKVANEAKKGSSQVATNTDADFNKANKSVQQSATDMYNGSKQSYSKMADVARDEGTRMYTGVKTSAEKMASSAKSAASDMYRGVTTSARLMANSVIGDWNRIQSSLNRSITGNIKIVKTTVNKEEKVGKEPKLLDTMEIPLIQVPDITPYNLDSGYYNSTSKKSRDLFESEKIKKSTTDNLLRELINVVTNPKDNMPPIVLNLDGREIARFTSRQMASNTRRL